MLTRAALIERVTELATGWPDDGLFEATMRQVLNHDAALRTTADRLRRERDELMVDLAYTIDEALENHHGWAEAASAGEGIAAYADDLRRERDEARAMCESQYDESFRGPIPERLHLADVIEKYVCRRLRAERDELADLANEMLIDRSGKLEASEARNRALVEALEPALALLETYVKAANNPEWAQGEAYGVGATTDFVAEVCARARTALRGAPAEGENG